MCFAETQQKMRSTSIQHGVFETIKTGLIKLKNLAAGKGMLLTPRQHQELLDSRIVLLALTQHKLRDQERKYRLVEPPLLTEEDSKETNYYLELAIQQLEEDGADHHNVDKLRSKIQKLLQTQTMKIFESFRSAELILNPDDNNPTGGALRNDLSVAKKFKRRHTEQLAKPLILKEYASLDKLYEKQHISFRLQKRQHMLQIMKVKKWNDFTLNEENNDKDISDNQSIEGDRERNMSEQILELAKGSLLKNYLGYSVLTLPSSIESAGRGLFVDGRADVGSIVAFFPGQVWPREYVIEKDFETKMLHHFANDENYELSLRYDDVLIDSRKEALEGHYHNNPWAIAQFSNHPPPNKMYNCRPVMINYMIDGDNDDLLKRFVPSSYARKPKFLGPKLIEGDVYMHGLVLLTTRDVCNEELFMNYRLNPKFENPEWYTVCDEEESKKRWGV